MSFSNGKIIKKNSINIHKGNISEDDEQNQNNDKELIRLIQRATKKNNYNSNNTDLLIQNKTKALNKMLYKKSASQRDKNEIDYYRTKLLLQNIKLNNLAKINKENNQTENSIFKKKEKMVHHHRIANQDHGKKYNINYYDYVKKKSSNELLDTSIGEIQGISNNYTNDNNIKIIFNNDGNNDCSDHFSNDNHNKRLKAKVEFSNNTINSINKLNSTTSLKIKETLDTENKYLTYRSTNLNKISSLTNNDNYIQDNKETENSQIRSKYQTTKTNKINEIEIKELNNDNKENNNIITNQNILTKNTDLNRTVNSNTGLSLDISRNKKSSSYNSKIKTKTNRTKIKISTNTPLLKNTDFTLYSSNINWFRLRQPKELKELSVNTLLPNNGYTDVTNFSENKLFVIKFQKEIQERFVKYNRLKTISPNFLFSRKMIQKITTLRDIFLEFDKDYSRMLELNELHEMFGTNDIPVELNELVQLFFRNQPIKKNEEPCLNFYQLIEFAFDDENEAEFEAFINKLKLAIVEENKRKAAERKQSFMMRNKTVTPKATLSGNKGYSEGNSKNKNKSKDFINNLESRSYGVDNYELNENNKDDKDNNTIENAFLPMTLNRLLDYFNKKGNIRANCEEIDQTIDNIDKVISIQNNKMKSTLMNWGNSIIKNKSSSLNIAISDMLSSLTPKNNVIDEESETALSDNYSKNDGINMLNYNRPRNLIYSIDSLSSNNNNNKCNTIGSESRESSNLKTISPSSKFKSANNYDSNKNNFNIDFENNESNENNDENIEYDNKIIKEKINKIKNIIERDDKYNTETEGEINKERKMTSQNNLIAKIKKTETSPLKTILKIRSIESPLKQGNKDKETKETKENLKIKELINNDSIITKNTRDKDKKLILDNYWSANNDIDQELHNKIDIENVFNKFEDIINLCTDKKFNEDSKEEDNDDASDKNSISFIEDDCDTNSKDILSNLKLGNISNVGNVTCNLNSLEYLNDRNKLITEFYLKRNTTHSSMLKTKRKINNLILKSKKELDNNNRNNETHESNDNVSININNTNNNDCQENRKRSISFCNSNNSDKYYNNKRVKIAHLNDNERHTSIFNSIDTIDDYIKTMNSPESIIRNSPIKTKINNRNTIFEIEEEETNKKLTGNINSHSINPNYTQTNSNQHTIIEGKYILIQDENNRTSISNKAKSINVDITCNINNNNNNTLKKPNIKSSSSNYNYNNDSSFCNNKMPTIPKLNLKDLNTLNGSGNKQNNLISNNNNIIKMESIKNNIINARINSNTPLKHRRLLSVNSETTNININEDKRVNNKDFLGLLEQEANTVRNMASFYSFKLNKNKIYDKGIKINKEFERHNLYSEIITKRDRENKDIENKLKLLLNANKKMKSNDSNNNINIINNNQDTYKETKTNIMSNTYKSSNKPKKDKNKFNKEYKTVLYEKDQKNKKLSQLSQITQATINANSLNNNRNMSFDPIVVNNVLIKDTQQTNQYISANKIVKAKFTDILEESIKYKNRKKNKAYSVDLRNYSEYCNNKGLGKDVNLFINNEKNKKNILEKNILKDHYKSYIYETYKSESKSKRKELLPSLTNLFKN